MSDSLLHVKDYMAEEFELEEEEINEMLEEFFESTRKLIDDAYKNLKEFNRDNLKHIGHALKGSSINIKAEELSELGKTIEDSAENSSPDDLKKYIDKFTESYKILKEQFIVK
jgi:HPt (histidine-containing phosphotransfer) domain-containing protein